MRIPILEQSSYDPKFPRNFRLLISSLLVLHIQSGYRIDKRTEPLKTFQRCKQRSLYWLDLLQSCKGEWFSSCHGQRILVWTGGTSTTQCSEKIQSLLLATLPTIILLTPKEITRIPFQTLTPMRNCLAHDHWRQHITRISHLMSYIKSNRKTFCWYILRLDENWKAADVIIWFIKLWHCGQWRWFGGWPIVEIGW